MNINQYDGSSLIKALAEELKNVPECKMPEWAMFVKTSVSKARPPMSDDWWYQRSASILRKVGLLGPIGVNKLKVKYGGKYRRGYKPAKFQKASGKIIRLILQQLEKAGLIKQIVISGHKGRILDAKGNAIIAKSAKNIVVSDVESTETVKEAVSVLKTDVESEISLKTESVDEVEEE